MRGLRDAAVCAFRGLVGSDGNFGVGDLEVELKGQL